MPSKPPALSSVAEPQGSLPAQSKAHAGAVLRLEGAAVLAMAENLPEGLADAVGLLAAVRGRVIVSGMGKSGHVARKIAATFASTGTPAQHVHPGEASHGDLGMITDADVVVLISNSGETQELADLIAYTRRFAIPLIAITQRPDSTLARQADTLLRLPDAPEACAIGLAPTTSTTCTMALGDALAVALMRLRGFERESFNTLHPGGRLGAQLAPVATLMHTGAELPVVARETAMGEALVEMTAKGFGVAALVEAGRLAGVITDGDLRRNLAGLMDKTAGEVATHNPRTVGPDTLASEALGLMNAGKISALLVIDADGALVGLLHIHDCLRAGVA